MSRTLSVTDMGVFDWNPRPKRLPFSHPAETAGGAERKVLFIPDGGKIPLLRKALIIESNQQLLNNIIVHASRFMASLLRYHFKMLKSSVP